MANEQISEYDPSLVVSQTTTFADWQTQLKLACEADRYDEVDAITSLRAPQRVILRQVTVVRDKPRMSIGPDSMLLAGGGRRTFYRDDLIPFESMVEREYCSPLPTFPERGIPAADEFLKSLLRAPYKFSGSCLFWTQSLATLKLLIDRGASTHDTGHMEIPLLVSVAQMGLTSIVRYLIGECNHDPNIARKDGGYTALHWATGVEVVQYLISQGASVNALTTFGDSVLAQQIRIADPEVVNYILGLGEEQASRANILHWLDARPEILRVLYRHHIPLDGPIEPYFGEWHAPRAMQRILRRGIELWQDSKESEDKSACANAVLECIDILRAHEWNPMLYDDSGRLPYHVVQDCLPNQDEPLRQELDARLARYDGPRKRPSQKRK